MANKQTHLILICLIIILGFGVYLNCLAGKFIWDDNALIKDNAYIKTWVSLPHLFRQNLYAGSRRIDNFWRPLQLISCIFDYSLWKLNVVGYHLTNVLLHSLVGLSVYWLVNVISGIPLVSFLTAAFFIVHPIHSEAVTYISGRADPLSGLFILLCLIFYLKQIRQRNTKLYILMLLSYGLGILSKEYSLILPLLLLVYHFVFKNRVLIREFLSLSGISLIYIVLRLTVLRFAALDLTAPLAFSQRIAGFFVAITQYLRILFLPFGLHMEYGYIAANIISPKALLGMAILACLLIYGFRKRKTNRLSSFAIFWFLAGLLPVSNIIYPVNAYMAEHWLYLPSIGFFLFFSDRLALLYQVKKYRIFTVIFIAALLGFYSYLTIRQNNYWQEPVAFYERTLKYAPHSARVYYNLAFTKANMNRIEEAFDLYKKAVELNPEYVDAYNNLGSLYVKTGRIDEAIASYKKAIGINPRLADAYNNLCNVYDSCGRSDEAIVACKKAIEIDNRFYDAYLNLGSVYESRSDFEQAIIAYNKALEINPKSFPAYNNLGNIYLARGNYAQAIAAYKKALVLNSGFAVVHNNLAVAYFYQKQYQLALQHCDRAAKLGYKDDKLQEALRPYRK